MQSVLEIGSGTGQHAVFFASELPHLYWQTSDLATNCAGIRAWVEHSELSNLGAPITLDVLKPLSIGRRYDAIFSANTAHIMSIDAVIAMFSLAPSCLRDDGLFCLYGPFNESGGFTSESNRRFDESLRAENPEMGIRDLEFIDSLANRNSMQQLRRYAMPANNQIVLWQYRP